MSLVLGLRLEHSCPWPRECLSSERLSLALALASDFFLCPWPWPWPRALCPRLHLWWKELVRLLELSNHTNLPANISEEQKKGLPAPQVYNFEQFWAILRGQFPHGLFLLTFPILNEEGLEVRTLRNACVTFAETHFAKPRA